MKPNRIARLRENARGNVWVSSVIALLGVGLLVVGLIFFLAGHTSWATPTGYVLLGLGTLAILGVVYHYKMWWGLVSLGLIAPGLIVLAGHYAGWF